MKQKIKFILCFLFLFLALFFFIVSEWVPSNFGDISFDEIIFQLMFPMDGADSDFITSFILKCLITPIILSLFINYLLLRNRKMLLEIVFVVKRKAKESIHISLFPLLRKSYVYVCIIAMIIGCTICIKVVQLDVYVNNYINQSTIFEEYYVDPAKTSFQFPQVKRNLVYLYMESMETTYYDKEEGGAQAVDLIPELHELAKQHTTFSKTGFIVPSLSSWTIAALVSHSAGLPLKIPVDGNSYANKNFLDGATTIGDILDKNGYNQMFMCGSDIAFAGRNYFFERHGNFQLLDYYSMIDKGSIPEDYYEWWGYEDQKLYTFAKEELLGLAEQEQPFNFTMLTADTHHVSGYLCEKCPALYDNQFANVLACSSMQMNEFVNWMKTQAFYENTTIIIAGDHTSMEPSFFENLDANYIRKGYDVIINPVIENTNEVDRLYTSLDLFPTTLASLGVSWNGNRLGLGTNLFSTEKTLIEALGMDEFQSQLEKASSFYNKNILIKK